MATSPRSSVEIDTKLLEQLRERDPEKSDRELLEDLAVIALGFETIRRVQERNAAAGVDDDKVMAEAVKAVHEVRAERTAERRATG